MTKFLSTKQKSININTVYWLRTTLNEKNYWNKYHKQFYSYFWTTLAVTTLKCSISSRQAQ